MYTVDHTLEALKKFDIDPTTLLSWEEALGLVIPVDAQGQKQYSPHHINLFKNIRKHLALGRSLDEIRRIITLPPDTASRVAPVSVKPYASAPDVAAASAPQQNGHAAVQATAITDSEPAPAPPTPTATVAPVTPERIPAAEDFAVQMQVPQTPQQSPQTPVAVRRAVPHIPQPSNGVVQLMEKLLTEKDSLHQKLVETEKLNSHLYNANAMFHRKVRDLTTETDTLKTRIAGLEAELHESASYKFLDEKARMQQQIIEQEKRLLNGAQVYDAKQREVDQLLQQLAEARNELARFQAHGFDPRKFVGDWVENGQLIEIAYDNFGINIEPERARVFRIADAPTRVFGATAIIQTPFEYENNTLWKRLETLVLTALPDQTLVGELFAEYILDGVPVAKAIYRVRCEPAPTGA